MNLDITITPLDIQNLQAIVAANQNRVFVKSRIQRNIEGSPPVISKEEIWLTMTMCQLTSQQRSSPTSPVSRFLLERPFRVSLEACRTSTSVEDFIQRELSHSGGIRFVPKIARQMSLNLSTLENGGWDDLQRHLDSLLEQRRHEPANHHFELEREAARYLQKSFWGLGPKQSRNFLQALGLTRYEFVLDSRVLKWLREMNFPFPLSPMALGEEGYYCFLSDILRDWCDQAQVLPCVLDAAIFSSYDAEDWPEDAAVW